MKLAILVFTSLGAFGAPLFYTESVNGDLSQPGFFDPPALTVLALDAGTNTISGNFGINAAGVTDWDSFAFTIPASMSFTTGSVQLTDAAGDIVATQWRVRTGSSYDLGTVIQNALFPASPGTDFFTGLPLGPGTYSVSQILLSLNGPNPRTADYVFTLTVENEIPEPATFGLVAVSLAGLFAAARRNRAR